MDGSRRQSKTRAPNTELEIPSAKQLLAREAATFEDADTTLRSQPAPATQDKPVAAKTRGETKSYVAARLSAVKSARSETKSYVAARFTSDASDTAEKPASSVEARGSAREHSVERHGPITEHPPTYVQRRDSNPTRMEIPAGPVGSPHRSFAPDPAPEPSRAVRASNHPFDMPFTAGAAGMNRGVLPDSLTPPISASRTAPPEAPAARPSSPKLQR